MSRKNAEDRAHVVVLGGGYAGVMAGIRLAGRARRKARVTLVDDKTTFVQRLRLHQVAAGQAIVEPRYAEILGRGIDFVCGRAVSIDTESNTAAVRSDGQHTELRFDRLVYALGSGVDIETVPGVAEHAHTVSDVGAARRLSQALRRAAGGSSVAVVGGGLTGLEAATEIATAYPALSVKLLTSGDAGGWLSKKAHRYLEKTLAAQGIEVVDHVRVGEVERGRVRLARGSSFSADIVVWCGGFRAASLAAESGLATDELGRLLVDRKLRAVSHPQIVGAGDAIATPAFNCGRPLRMCCQVAIPTAVRAAETVLAELKGREPKDLRFGYVHQPLSLGRRTGLIQFVDRGDQPREAVLTGWRAALYKELVSRSPLTSFRLERLMPGATTWPFKEPKPAPSAGAEAVA